ncbi:FecR domain-containing protein [Chitinophaga sancti]|uniref:FecR family protein n=1 Tax=Chitinophaga sancti TaxID=1004 RepID=UPI002A7588C7|nr:FecR domain-containing protein [Chitinophaga sancti]WPQ63384.1 FecR domain-containing protein [Chitinophaga sancti]
MSVNPEYIEQLVLDEIAGVITPEDSATLNNLLVKEPEALVIRNDLYKQYSEHPALHDLPRTLSVEKVWEGIRKQRKGYAFLRAAMGIAAAILVIFGSHLLFSPGARKPALAQKELPATNNNIVLRLPGGQEVNLGNSQQKVQIGDLTLQNKEKKLSYVAPSHYGNQMATLVVPQGKDYALTLSDGTEIQLNAATKLSFPFSFDGKTREITVSGEAYVKVAPDAIKPFFVHLPNSTIQVLGTEFNVNTYDIDQERVSLVKGAIKLGTNKDSILLHPGFSVSSSPEGNLHEIPFDAEEILSWRQGIYIFQNANVNDMAKVITRWFGIQVIVDNPMKAHHKFRGSINKNQPIHVFLDGLKFTGQFDYHFDKDSVLHMQ